jgi:putative transposase
VCRFRLLPDVEQAAVLADHYRHPGYNEQCTQLTAARAEYDWLKAGSQTVQQQALRDFAQGMRNFFGGTHRRPTWRKAGTHEGFRQVGLRPRNIQRLNRRYGQVWIPKVGWVRFHWTRAIADTVKSYRVTLDRSGRWHIAFAAIPDPIPGPGDGSVVGIDRGIAVSVALSNGQLLRAPGLRAGETTRLCRLQQRLARARPGSARRARTKLAIAKVRARDTDRRRDWVEKTTTDVARRFDTIRVEDLKVRAMTRSARGTAGRPAQAQGPGSAGIRPSRVYVAKMPLLRAPRAGKPQEPSGFPVRRLWRGAVPCRRERGTQHRRRTGGDSTGRPRH